MRTAAIGAAIFLALLTGRADAALSSDELFDPEWRGRNVTTEGVVHNVERLPDGRIELDVYRNVAASIRGKEKPLVTLDEQRRLIKLLEIVFDAAAKGEVAHIEL